jgi:hypothetical protein
MTNKSFAIKVLIFYEYHFNKINFEFIILQLKPQNSIHKFNLNVSFDVIWSSNLQ